jgi:transposase, IS30 family
MQLQLWELYTIKTLVSEGYLDIEISAKLHRNKSVISRLFEKYDRTSFIPEEVLNNRHAVKKENSQKYARIKPWGNLETFIITQIQEWLSPEQIAWVWKKDTKENLSKDTVYSFIYEQRPELGQLYLRRKWKKYRKRKQEKIDGKYQIQERRMIDARPKEVEERKRIWDWEGDTIIGKDHKWAILTLVERKTGFLFAYKLEQGKNATWVTNAIRKLWANIPPQKRRTLTFDNGREFADHKMLEYFMKTLIYFAHAYHSRERWTNENTNGLLREYIPKKTDFTYISQDQLDIFVKKINLRPRKRLSFFTPYECFHSSCVSL